MSAESPSDTEALGLHELKGGGSSGLGGGSDQGASRTETGKRGSEQQLPGRLGAKRRGWFEVLAMHGHRNPPGG